MLNDVDWYAANNITLHLNKKIVKIDRRAQGDRRRRHRSGIRPAAARDRLQSVHAADSRARISTGVITYRDIQDTNAMIEAAARYKHAVVIGGGLLGLEAANGLKLRGMNVTVVHLMEWLMERQLDRTAAGMLQKSLEAKGLQFMLKTQTAEIVGDRDDGKGGRVKSVRFKDGERDSRRPGGDGGRHTSQYRAGRSRRASIAIAASW